MLAPQRLSYHTGCTEMLFVKNAVFEQVVNRLLRLPAAAAFRDKAWVRGHRHEVEVCSEAVEHGKCDVQKEISVQGI
jgi:hypothetical protein